MNFMETAEDAADQIDLYLVGYNRERTLEIIIQAMDSVRDIDDLGDQEATS
jgi:hypothetical protein